MWRSVIRGKLDLKSAYYHVELALDVQKLFLFEIPSKGAKSGPFDKYVFRRMPMGWNKAAEYC